MNVVRRIGDIAEKILKVICVTFFAIIFVVGLWQVFSRYVLDFSFSWTQELDEFLYIWVVFLGSVILVRRNGHIAMRFLVQKITIRWIAIVIRMCISVGIIAFLIVLMYKGFVLAVSFGGTVSSALRVPETIVYMIMPIAGLLMLLAFIESLVRSFRASAAPETETAGRGD